MNVDLFDYDLPKSLIAQHPSQQRDHSRMMVINRATQSIDHRHFYDIIDELDQHDVLVINDTKVIPARLIGLKAETNAVIEILLLISIDGDTWETIAKPARRVKKGTIVEVSDQLKMTCLEERADGIRVMSLSYEGILMEVLERLGTLPLPPYITALQDDINRYQTVYADKPTSAAAPTAGLHFTRELLEKLSNKGIETIPITLNVGLGTFRPVSATLVEEHVMHEETYTISVSSAKRLNEAKRENKRIVAVGTTSLRTLESNYDDGFRAGTYETGIFIYPGYTFKVTDRLITNFHLPKSTLLMLVSAFSSLNLIRTAYEEAVSTSYRFFSFGDAMLIK
ncbi:MAG: tRNA preQ1(34) S-adenosylmethionine ribosyltransferase-isomerase QueA [Acholeplasmataceae bacterium]|nr:tRNA preQ1(34) S-adenosylmethionine ribosyltransferase-isomerase QueA [Acholeplasmataceae bacterium]